MMSYEQQAIRFAKIIDEYRAAFKRHGDSMESVLWTKGRQKIRFVILTAHILDDGFSILDFGCGLAHLKDYLDERFKTYKYSGADFVPEFIANNRTRHSRASFYEVDTPARVPGEFDHVLMSGIFNLCYAENEEENFEFVKRVLREAFTKTKVSLAVDFRRDRTNYREPNAYYQSLPALYDFACSELSSRIKFDLSYMPYEYSMIVFKDSAPVEPVNVYRGYEYLQRTD
jgi:SAM-dependent methyltransferase